MQTNPGTEPAVEGEGAHRFDPTAWVEDHGDALYRFALRRIGRHDLAEDLVQETFLAALSAFKSFEGRCAGRSWLIAILRRKIVDHHRRIRGASQNQTAPALFDRSGSWVDPPSTWKSPESLVEDQEFRGAVDTCLEGLPQHLAEPFLLRECEGIATDDVRSMLDLKPENLRVRLHRARLLLRDCLERNWFRDQEA